MCPEGVEVKLSGELISPLVIGKKVKKAYATPNSRYANNSKDMGAYNEFIKTSVMVKSVATYGKFMYWTFDDNWTMFCTFGMSGQWSPTKGNNPCFVFEFDDETSVCFNDTRHFGTIQFTHNPQDLKDKLKTLGWDPLQESLTEYFPWLKQTLGISKKSIGELLMDQSVFAGVGNYIRAEALYHCKLSPFRISNSLKEDEIRQLCQSIIDVMTESYEHQGATIQTYKTPYGEEGRYSSCFKVYGKKKDPLGNKIVKEDSGGRSIHWCPTVQVL